MLASISHFGRIVRCVCFNVEYVRSLVRYLMVISGVLSDLFFRYGHGNWICMRVNAETGNEGSFLDYDYVVCYGFDVFYGRW